MDPRDLFAEYRRIEDQGLDVIGYYHSHTHTEARPSPTDVRLAQDLTDAIAELLQAAGSVTLA